MDQKKASEGGLPTDPLVRRIVQLVQVAILMEGLTASLEHRPPRQPPTPASMADAEALYVSKIAHAFGKH
jgi:hypothetical protein